MTLVQVNSNKVNNLKRLVESIFIPFVMDKDVAVVFENAKALPPYVSRAIRRMTKAGELNYRGFHIPYDATRQKITFDTEKGFSLPKYIAELKALSRARK